jgi:hypothetical protein
MVSEGVFYVLLPLLGNMEIGSLGRDRPCIQGLEEKHSGIHVRQKY